MTVESGSQDAAARPVYSNAYRGYVLGMLVLGYIFNTVDRGVLGVLLQPIKEQFQFTDTQLGLLGGIAFALFYSVLGIPIARLADAWSRVNVLTIAVALWSIATALCGAAQGFYSLICARIGTAVGESGGSPPSHSLISDYFPSKIRGTALSIYAMAVPFGTAIGNYASGWLNVAFGWRLTFVLVGLPGLTVALLLRLTVKEPPRGYSDTEGAIRKHETPAMWEACKYLCTRWSFMHMSMAAALHSVVWYAGSTWNASFFMRSHGMDTKAAGAYLAIFALVGTVGTFTGGLLSDRLSTRTGDRRWYMWVPGIACVIMVPFQFVSYLSPDMRLVVPAFSVMVILASMFFGPSFAVAQALATVRMRAVSTSILLFVQTLIGLGLGPLFAGMISDQLEPTVGKPSLSYGLVIVGMANIWAAVHYFLGARSYRADLAKTEQLNKMAAGEG
ncbi:MAG: MFS transporter [Gammaproteobacteria bacterium]|nr:MAG: MFS transporter [Gammaproteobacteria bacterium]